MEPEPGSAAGAQALGATGRMGAAASTMPAGSVGILGAWENREGKTGTQSAAQEKVCAHGIFQARVLEWVAIE